jgi:hypothetical protein
MSVFLGGVWRAPGGRGEPPAAAQADFRVGVPAGGVTVSRASGGTRFDVSGNLAEIASTNSQRVDFNPANLTVRGLLIEPTRTNLLTHPRSVGDAGWTRVNVTYTAVAARNGAANQAAQLAENVGTGQKFVRQSAAISYTAGERYTHSAILRAETHSFAQLVMTATAFGSTVFQTFDLAAGALGSAGVDNTGAGMIPLGGGDWLCWVSGDATATTTGDFATIALVASASAGRNAAYTGVGNTIVAQFPQIEIGAGPSSRVLPPVGSPAASTRATETATLAAPDGSYDALIQDNAGAEWRLAETVSGGAYALVPRAGQPFFHISRARLFPASVLSAAQRAALEVPA